MTLYDHDRAHPYCSHAMSMMVWSIKVMMEIPMVIAHAIANETWVTQNSAATSTGRV